MLRNRDRIDNGQWKGCGHKVRPYFTCEDPICFTMFYYDYMDFLDTNAKAVCLECWRRERGSQHAEVHA